jgi:hypothetical protein
MDEKKLTEKEFVVAAINNLRKPPYKGIHTVVTGFNGAFREYFGGKDPVACVEQLKAEGVIEGHVAKKGAMIYLKGEMPTRFAPAERNAETIGKITGDAPKGRKLNTRTAAKHLEKAIQTAAQALEELRK